MKGNKIEARKVKLPKSVRNFTNPIVAPRWANTTAD